MKVNCLCEIIIIYSIIMQYLLYLKVIIEAIAQLVERTTHNSNCKCSSHFSLIN